MGIHSKLYISMESLKLEIYTIELTSAINAEDIDRSVGKV